MNTEFMLRWNDAYNTAAIEIKQSLKNGLQQLLFLQPAFLRNEEDTVFTGVCLSTPGREGVPTWDGGEKPILDRGEPTLDGGGGTYLG